MESSLAKLARLGFRLLVDPVTRMLHNILDEDGNPAGEFLGS